MANAEAPFAGAQDEFVGLDQCNVRLRLCWLGYDFNRLTNATANAFSRSYSFDEWGNIKNFSGLTLSYQTNASGAPSTNRINTDSQGYGYSYDSAGNMTTGMGQSFSYDGANRLKEVGTGGANVYGYDGDGKRVKKTENGATTYYVYSSKLGQSVMEVTANGIQRAYVYSGSKLVAMQATDGQFYWLHTNHLGNSRAMTDASGNLTYKGQFDPYGASLTEWSGSGNTNLNSKKFTGYERDSATGLDYAGARMLSSGRGRFTTPDPLGLGSVDFKRPATLNRYAYVENDPVNKFDPSGYLAVIVLNVNETFDADWNIRDGSGAIVSRRDVIEAILASLGLDPAKAKLGEDFEFFTWKGEFNATTGDVDSASYVNALGRLTTLINIRMGRRRQGNPLEQLNIVARSVGTQLARDYAKSQDAEYGINTLVTVTPVWGSRGDIIGGRINNFLNLSASNRNTFCGVNFGESILMTSNYWSATAFNKLLGFLTGSNGPLQPGQNLSDLRGFVGGARGCGFTRERIIGRGDGRPIAE